MGAAIGKIPSNGDYKLILLYFSTRCPVPFFKHALIYFKINKFQNNHNERNQSIFLKISPL